MPPSLGGGVSRSGAGPRLIERALTHNPDTYYFRACPAAAQRKIRKGICFRVVQWFPSFRTRSRPSQTVKNDIEGIKIKVYQRKIGLETTGVVFAPLLGPIGPFFEFKDRNDSGRPYALCGILPPTTLYHPPNGIREFVWSIRSTAIQD